MMCLESTRTRLLLNEAGGVFVVVGGGIWWYPGRCLKRS